MNDIIKGLLINPEEETITEVEVKTVDGNQLASMYELLDCDLVDCLGGGLTFLPSGCTDDIWVDDEGCFRADIDHRFELPDWVPLIGCGLILGHDGKGNCTSHTLTKRDIEVLKEEIVFHN